MTVNKMRKWIRASVLASTLAAGGGVFGWNPEPIYGRVEFDTPNYTVSEGSSSDIVLSVRVRRIEGSSGYGSVRVALAADGTATPDQDFLYTDQNISWSSGDSTAKVVPVTIKHDWIDEPEETFRLYLTNPQNVTIGNISETVITISDNDGCKDKAGNACACGTAGCYDSNGAFKFSSTSFSGIEDLETQNGQIAIQISRGKGSEGPVSVEFATVAGGTASPGTDYQETVQTVSWGHGDTADKTVHVPTLQDSVDESDQTIYCVLRNPTGEAVLGTQTNATAIILDNDDYSFVSISPPSTTAAYEENSGSKSIDFTVSLSAASEWPISVDLDFSGGNATLYEDFRIDTAMPLSFAPGEISKIVTVSVFGDSTYEPDESIIAEIGACENALSGSPFLAQYVVQNDDLNPEGGCKDKNNLPCPCGSYGCVSYGNGEIRFASATYSGSEDQEAQNGHISIQVERVHGDFGTVSVEFATIAGGTTTAGVDYVPTTQILTWAERDSSVKTVNLEIIADPSNEPDETIHAVLRNVTEGGEIISPQTVAIEILNNDSPPTAEISPKLITEGDGDILFEVNLSEKSGFPIQFNYSCRPDSSGSDIALPNVDYIPVAGSLSFAPGEVRKQFTLSLLDDMGNEVYEGNENFHIDLNEQIQTGSPSRVTIQDPDNLITIIDNEEVPRIAAPPSVVSFEKTSSTIDLPIRLSVASKEAITASVTFEGPATLGADYQVLTPTSFVYNPGETIKSLRLQVLNDEVYDPYERIFINVNGQRVAKVLIVNGDDLAYFEIKPIVDVVLGPNQQIRFEAIGKNSSGNVVESNPIWGLNGPGVITQNGLYISPSTGEESQTIVQVAQEGIPEIQGFKTIGLDNQPPRLADLRIEPGETVSGVATLRWKLADTPDELSMPVTYQVLLDEKIELYRFTTSSRELDYQFNSSSFPNGEHSISVVATDGVKNSNFANAPLISFEINNGGDSLEGTAAGLDWLLTHQSRSMYQNHGSWKISGQLNQEIIIETAFAAQTLSSSNLTYTSRNPNITSSARVSVAEAYHDAIVWLGVQWNAGKVHDFIDKAIVSHVLYKAASKRRRLISILGSVSNDFDSATRAISGFASGEEIRLSRNEDGSFAGGEESLGSRFETIAAIRSALASENLHALQTLLQQNNGSASIAVYLQGQRSEDPNKGAWRNTNQINDADFNFYLSAELASGLYELSKIAPEQEIVSLLTEAYGFLQQNQNPNGGFPEVNPNIVDTAAGIHALVSGKMASVPFAIDDNKIAAASSYMFDGQTGGGWNNRALDTAFALKALRPELRTLGDSLSYDYENQQVQVSVENIGAIMASAVRISAFSQNPALLIPEERSRYLMGSAILTELSPSGVADVTIPIIQSNTPRHLFIMIDAEERIAEYDDENNTAEWSLPELPNLAVYDFEISAKSSFGSVPVAGSTWIVTARIHNHGLTPIPVKNNLFVHLYEGNPLTDADARYLRPETLHEFVDEGVTSLAAGEWVDVEFDIIPERYDLQTPGIHDLYVWVDPNSGRGDEIGVFAEQNEHDNLAHKLVEVFESGDKPDLSISPEAIVLDQNPASPDRVGRVRVRVDSIGIGGAEAFDLHVSTDEFGTSEPIRIGDLPSGQSAVVFVPFAVNTTGTFTVHAYADVENVIRESNEVNNHAYATFTVDSGNSTYNVGLTADDLSIDLSGSHPQNAANIRKIGKMISESDAVTLQTDWNFEYGSSGLQTTPAHDSRPGIEFGLGDALSVISDQDAFTASDTSVVYVECTTNLFDSQGSALDTQIENNTAERTFFIGKTNLRAISLEGNPNPAVISDGTKSAALVSLTAVVRNGDGIESDLVTVPSVDVEIRDAVTSRVLGYWNNLVMAPFDSDAAEGEDNCFSLTVPDVELMPGTHRLQVEIDPVDYYVETNEDDNIADLILTVEDAVPNRDEPDLAFDEGLAFEINNGRLYVRASVKNIADSSNGEPVSISAPVNLRFYRSEGGDFSSATPINVESIDVPALSAGESFSALTLTGIDESEITAQTRIWAFVDSEEVVTESNDGNNIISSDLDKLTMGPVIATAIFDTILLRWDVVPETTAYRVARFVVENDVRTWQKAWILEATVSELTDSDSELEAENTYVYRVWAQGENGLWSAPEESNLIEIGKLPRITWFYDGERITTSGPEENGEITAATTKASSITLATEFTPGASLVLFQNYLPVAEETVAPDGMAIFEAVAITEPVNSFRVVAEQNSEGRTYSGFSNSVIVYHKMPLPDLCYEYRDSPVLKPDVKAYIKHSESTYEELLDFGAVAKYRGKEIQVRIKYNNTGYADVVTSFSSRLDIMFSDGTLKSSNSVCYLDQGTGDATISVNAESGDASIKEIMIYLDQSLELIPGGQIAEISESNNILRLIPSGKQSISSHGDDFWSLYPYNIGELGQYNDLMLGDDDGSLLFPQFDFQQVPSASSMDSVEIEVLKADGSQYNGNIDQDPSYVFESDKTSFWRYPFGPPCTSYGCPWNGPLLDYYNSLSSSFNYRRDFKFYNSAIHFKSSTDIGMSLIKPSKYVQDACMVFPTAQLGEKYIVSSFHHQTADDYNDDIGKFRSYFQILGIENGVTNVIIRKNYLGIPDFSDLQEGTIIENGNAYKIEIQKNQSYLWVTGHDYEDPTGITIESENNKKFVVFSGSSFLRLPGKISGDWSSDIFSMAPSYNMLGKTYLLPTVPENLGTSRTTYEEVSGIDFAVDEMARDINGNPIDGCFQNHFSRIIATEDNTSVTLMPGNSSFSLMKGQWLEVGENSLEYDYDQADDPYYSSLTTGVKRIIDSNEYARAIQADKDVLVTTYLTEFYYGGGMQSYYSGEKNTFGGYGGSAIIMNAPVSSADTRELIPIGLVDGRFLNGRQYLTIMTQLDNGVTPTLYLANQFSTETAEEVASLSFVNNQSEYRDGVSYGWQSISGVNGEPFIYCTIPLPKDLSSGLCSVYNPTHAPVLLRHIGYCWYGSFGKPAGNWSGKFDPYDYEAVVNDLEITLYGIRFPYNTTIREGVPIKGQIEILNNGTFDIDLSTQSVTLKIWETFSDRDDVLITEINVESNRMLPYPDLILRKRLAQFPVDFDYTPTQGATGIKAEIFMDGDGDPTNNSAHRIFAPGFVQRPDFDVISIDAVWPQTRNDCIQVTATIASKNVHVDHVPVRWTYGFVENANEGQVTVDVVARFLPDSIITGSPYLANTTVTLEIPNPGRAGEFLIAVEVNPDYTIPEQSGSSEGNKQSISHVFEHSNLALQTTLLSGSTALLGDNAQILCEVINDGELEYSNVLLEVVLGSGQDAGAPILFKETIQTIQSGETIEIPASFVLPFDGEVVVTARLTVPIDQIDDDIDNYSQEIIHAFDSTKTDLTLDEASHNFAIPDEITRGDSIQLEAFVENIGMGAVEQSYKLQVFDGGISFSTGEIVAEAIFDVSTTNPQEFESTREFTETWDTTTATLGEHVLNLVIDSNNHLAVPSISSDGVPSGVPMKGNRLSSSGIMMVDIPLELQKASWILEAYATDDPITTETEKLGSFISGYGFIPVWNTLGTTGPLSVQLRLSSSDGEPLPLFDQPLSMEIGFLQKLEAQQTIHSTKLRVTLPPNDLGQYGTGSSFWLADDGSTYFAHRMHLASRFGAIGEEDMTAEAAMSDGYGEIDESNELNNTFTQVIEIMEETDPDFVISDLRIIPSIQDPGKIIQVEADITNWGADTASQVWVSLDVQKIGSSTWSAAETDKVILEPLIHGVTVTRTFIWQTGSPGNYQFRASVDPDNEVSEIDNGNNTAIAQATVSSDTAITFAPVGGPFQPNEGVAVTVTVESEENTSAMLAMEVISASENKEAGSVDLSENVPFNLSGTTTFDRTWNTGASAPGEYHFIAELVRLNKLGIKEVPLQGQSDDFTILAPKNLSAFIQTERYAYEPGEYVRFIAGLRNDSPGYVFPELTAKLDIRNDGLTSEPISILPVKNVRPGEVRTIDGLAWMVPAEYLDSPLTTIVLTVFEDLNEDGERQLGEAYAIADTDFQVKYPDPIVRIDKPTSGTYHTAPTVVSWSSPRPVDVVTSEGLVTAIPFQFAETEPGVEPASISSGDSVTTEGIIIVDAWAIGRGGQRGETASVVFYIDRTVPSIAVENSLVDYSEPADPVVLVSGFADDSDGAGISAIDYRKGADGAWLPVISIWSANDPAYPTRMNYSIFDSQSTGSYQLFIQATDLAGNKSSIVERNVVFDTEPPQIPYIAPYGNITAENFTIEAHITDDVSGVDPDSVFYQIISADGVLEDDRWTTMSYFSGPNTNPVYKADVSTWSVGGDGPFLIYVKASDNALHDDSTLPADQNPNKAHIWVDLDMPPQVPTGVRAYYISYSEIEVKWNTNTEPDFKDYDLRRTVASDPMDIRDVPNLSNETHKKENTFIDNQVGITEPSYYEYSLRGRDVMDNKSTWSMPIQVPAPDAPSNLTAVAGNNQVELAWEPVSEGFIKGYDVYRSTQYDTGFALLDFITSPTVQYIDNSVLNDTIYYYYVTALDGADNQSLKSSTVIAAPGLPNEFSVMHITFEDVINHPDNLWDFNDVGATIYAQAMLTPDDNVSTLVVTAVGALEPHSLYNHDIKLSFFKLNGTATWTGTKWDANDTSRTEGNELSGGTYAVGEGQFIPLFIDSQISVPYKDKVEPYSDALPNITGDVCQIVMTINNPSANPASTFEKAPFDTYITVTTDFNLVYDIHIFDPERPEFDLTGQYITDHVNYISPDYPENYPLGGQYVSNGLCIPRTNWIWTGEYQRLWSECNYPYFGLYLPTVRDDNIKYRNWYDFRDSCSP